MDLVPGKVSSITPIFGHTCQLIWRGKEAFSISLILLDYLLVPVHPDPHAFLNVCGSNTICEIHHKLGKLLHIDDVPGHCLIDFWNCTSDSVIDASTLFES